MRRLLTYSAIVLALLAAMASAQEWVGFAGISQTMDAQAGRVCLGEGDATDAGIGCPAYAPSVTTSGDVSVSGNISANKFIGDGSGLTNLPGGGVSDRIVSGTASRTRIVAISDTVYISITQANTNTGWFDPTRGLVTLGVSTTGVISGTKGYFSENVGIGLAAPGELLHLRGGNLMMDGSPHPSLMLLTNSNTGGHPVQTFVGGANVSEGLVGGQYFMNFVGSWNGQHIGSIEVRRGTSVDQGQMAFRTSNGGGSTIERMRIKPDGKIGINTIDPAAWLQIMPATTEVGLLVRNTDYPDYRAVRMFHVRSCAMLGDRPVTPVRTLDRKQPRITKEVQHQNERYDQHEPHSDRRGERSTSSSCVFLARWLRKLRAGLRHAFMHAHNVLSYTGRQWISRGTPVLAKRSSPARRFLCKW